MFLELVQLLLQFCYSRPDFLVLISQRAHVFQLILVLFKLLDKGGFISNQGFDFWFVLFYLHPYRIYLPIFLLTFNYSFLPQFLDLLP